MPTKMENFDFKRQKKEREAQFLQYFDGEPWSVTLQETDYKTLDSLRSAIYSEADDNGLKIRTTKVDDDTLVFQSLGPRPEKAEKSEPAPQGASEEE